uniref:Tubulin--tyrosine ligase-like protein 9 n=1 Tax=Hemiselmis andersenii TaxID=464988 RepID=A0A7S1ENG5_HEMAN|mmetsp:Transcript_52953/g.128322  ORF Transcript_52953/g.128322 Transcript_52953/m.128322 type:complete len:320 (-) Transcript_52953:40-999(-)
MLIVGSDYSLSMSMNKGAAVDKFCDEAAARGEQRVRDLMQGVSGEPRRPWMIQKYIERPLLVDQRKFHLRATVLAVGRLKVYLHTQMVALTASRPYSTTNLEDLAAHASNHSVQERVGDAKASEEGTCLLRDLHHRVDTTPAILRTACRLHGEKPDSIYVSGYGWHHTSSDPSGHKRDASFDPQEFGSSWACDVWGEALRIVRVIFHAATHSKDATKKQARIFFPLPSCFELFGVDIMLDLDGRVWLLEVNCDPDFKVFGDAHKGVAQRIVDDALALAIDPVFPPPSEAGPRPNGFRLAFEHQDCATNGGLDGGKPGEG